MRETPKCSVDGCGKLMLQAHPAGMCAPHRAKLAKFGDPNWVKPKAGEAPCAIDGCPGRAVARGWCSRHWQRWNRVGNPQGAKPRANAVVDYSDGTRECRACGDRLPIEQFDRDGNASGGRRAQCKACRGKKVADWYADNRERQRGRAQNRRKENADAVRKAEAKRYRRDKLKRIELAVESAHRRRDRIANSERVDKGIRVSVLRKRDGDRCYLCRKVMSFTPRKRGDYNPRRASIEHLVPIHQGGLHVWENVVLTCLGCNLRRPKKDDHGGEQLLLIG